MNPTTPLISVRDIAHSLGRSALIWLNSSQSFYREAVSALQVSTGFTVSMIQQALESAFSELTEEKILAYLSSEPAFEKTSDSPTQVLHILAGNVFTAWLPGAVTTLLLGADCDLKPSSQERVFASLWKRSLEEVDPALARHVNVVLWEEGLLFRYPAVVAYGSDETLAALRAPLTSRVRFIGYGHKFSVGIVWKDALKTKNHAALLEQLRKDIEPFHLQGCLSPQVLYVEKGTPEGMADLLSNFSLKPRVQSFDFWDSLKAALRGFVPHLSAIGMAGNGKISKRDMDDLGVSRVCRLGEMQRPPLTWRNGGFSLAEALRS